MGTVWRRGRFWLKSHLSCFDCRWGHCAWVRNRTVVRVKPNSRSCGGYSLESSAWDWGSVCGVGLAFSNYRTKPLKHSPSLESSWADQPSQAWTARKRAEGLVPLREGPAFRHGARAQFDNDLG